MVNTHDLQWMDLALRLAAHGLGRTGDNPSVGCVIVRETSDGMEVLGRGRTGDGGTPHGEVRALAMVGNAARGATLYVTLEPCSHFGKSPPCADAIIEAGITRVVVGVMDPNPKVSGDGVARLKEAGIVVETGVLEDEASWVTAGHILRITENRPFVQMKIATGADGLIAPGDGDPVWVTGDLARRRGHLLRAQADAILVGIGTVEADDPSLDCRLPGLAPYSPMPVVLDTHLRIDPECRLVSNSGNRPLHIFCGSFADDGDIQTRADKLRGKGVQIRQAGVTVDGRLNPRDVLGGLRDIGVTRLMIEGGPSVCKSFHDAELIDEVVVFRGELPLGEKGLLPVVESGLEVFDDPEKWQLQSEFSCGGDTMMVKRHRKTLAHLAQN